MEIHRHEPDNSETARLLQSELIYESEGHLTGRKKPPMLAYRTFDSTATNSHKKALTRGYIHYSTSGESSNDSCQPNSTYSAANSHEIYGILSETSDKIYVNGIIKSPTDNYSSNYEIANSHSNYQVFYNRKSSICGSIDDLNNHAIWPVNKNPDIIDNYTSTISEDSDTSACDIKQCLMQIEESLLNIEQNLLHVQDLEIPQLNNLLCKRTAINIDCNDEKLQSICKLNCPDERPLSEKNYSNIKISSLINKQRLSRSDNDISIDRNVNFITTNSYNELPQTFNKSLIKKSKTFIDNNYNLSQNSMTNVINCNFKINKKKNSLDETMNFNCENNQKILLNNYFSKTSMPSLNSKDLIQGHKKRDVSRRSINMQSSECLFNEINAKAEEFRKKIKNIAALDKTMINIHNKNDDYQVTEDIGIDKKFVNDNRKVKNKIQNSLKTSESAILPNKLLSLSFSLLLAALLQAVRCLADLVEDTFRSITFDKYALHE